MWKFIIPVILTIWYSFEEASISLKGWGCTLTSTLITFSAIGTLKLSPSPMIRFSTLPHMRTTPRWTAGTMANVPQATIRMTSRMRSIPTVRGVGPLNSSDSNERSGIIHPFIQFRISDNLVYFVNLVDLVYFVNQTNQRNQTNQTNRI